MHNDLLNTTLAEGQALISTIGIERAKKQFIGKLRALKGARLPVKDIKDISSTYITAYRKLFQQR